MAVSLKMPSKIIAVLVVFYPWFVDAFHLKEQLQKGSPQEFFIRADINQDEKLTYNELIKATLEEVVKFTSQQSCVKYLKFFLQNKDAIAEFLERQEYNKVDNWKARVSNHALVQMAALDINQDSFLTEHEFMRPIKTEF